MVLPNFHRREHFASRKLYLLMCERTLPHGFTKLLLARAFCQQKTLLIDVRENIAAWFYQTPLGESILPTENFTY